MIHPKQIHNQIVINYLSGIVKNKHGIKLLLFRYQVRLIYQLTKTRIQNIYCLQRYPSWHGNFSRRRAVKVHESIGSEIRVLAQYLYGSDLG